MAQYLCKWLRKNVASRCNCTVPWDAVGYEGFYFEQGVSFRGFIGGEERLVQEIATHIETIVRQRRFVPVHGLNLMVYSECPVLISSLDVQQCGDLLS